MRGRQARTQHAAAHRPGGGFRHLISQYQGFAEAIETGPDATAFDRALSLSGRDPDWKKPG